jgi:hypothetical protein
VLDIDGFYVGLMAWLAGLAAQRFVRAEGLTTVHVTRSVDEALDVVERFV